MRPTHSVLRPDLLVAVGLLALAAGAARAAPTPLPVPLTFEGAGNVVVFDAAAGTGGWVGAVTEYSDPAAPLADPWSFATVVTFSFDSATRSLIGHFELTDATDLAASLYGSLTGSFVDPASSLATGGQLSLDYVIAGGTGRLAGYGGYGLSFLTFDPASLAFDNYAESGVLVATVPEPSTALLLALGLGVFGIARRRLA